MKVSIFTRCTLLTVAPHSMVLRETTVDDTPLIGMSGWSAAPTGGGVTQVVRGALVLLGLPAVAITHWFALIRQPVSHIRADRRLDVLPTP